MEIIDSFKNIREQFSVAFEQEKQHFTAEEIKLIEYWWTHDQEIFKRQGRWNYGKEILDHIIESIFFMSIYYRGMRHNPRVGPRVEDKEYVIDKCSPAFRRRIMFIDNYFMNPPTSGPMAFEHLLWTRLPKNISLLTELKWLWLTGMPIGDIEPLRGLPLHSLCLSGCPISTIEPILGMPISWLRLMQTNIDSLRVIENLNTLSYCPVNDTPLGKSAIDSLESVPYLNATNIRETKIKTFPEMISLAVHKERGEYTSKVHVVSPYHTKNHTPLWQAIYSKNRD